MDRWHLASEWSASAGLPAAGPTLLGVIWFALAYDDPVQSDRGGLPGEDQYGLPVLGVVSLQVRTRHIAALVRVRHPVTHGFRKLVESQLSQVVGTGSHPGQRVTILGSEVDKPASGETVRRPGIVSVVVCAKVHFVRAEQFVNVEVLVNLVVEHNDGTALVDVDLPASRVEAQSGEQPVEFHSEELVTILEEDDVLAPGEESGLAAPVGIGATEFLRGQEGGRLGVAKPCGLLDYFAAGGAIYSRQRMPASWTLNVNGVITTVHNSIGIGPGPPAGTRPQMSPPITEVVDAVPAFS